MAAYNKQLQRTVIRRRGDAACAPFHYAHASRSTWHRAAAELRRYAARKCACATKLSRIALILALATQSAAAVELEFTESVRSSISDAQRRAIHEMAASIEDDVRKVLPSLPMDIVVEVRAELQPYSRTGASGAALGPRRIAWVVDTSRSEGAVSIAEQTLRSIMFHEFHHLARGCTQGGPPFRSFLDGAICEGMATAFGRDFAGAEQPWATYPSEVERWYEEVKDLPAAATTGEWMFFHSDGRAWVGYKVGTFLVDRAMEASGRSAADLVGVASEDVIELAGYK